MLGPPIFGWFVEAAGYHASWIGLALSMLAGLGLLAMVHEPSPFRSRV
jgi:hypothetical protein